MTFDDIKAAIKSYVNLTSTEADTRVGASVNRHYRRITSLLGMDSTRFVTRSTSMTVGVQTVEFSEIEKIDRLLDTTDSSSIRLLRECGIHAIRSTQPGTGAPCQWAVHASGGDSVTVVTDTIPQTAYSLQADGWTTLADLQGTDSPAFPESFHDILVWFVIAEELLKKEKLPVAAAYEAKAEKLLADLRFHFADSPTRETRQASSALTTPASGSAGGGGSLGATAYTQSALLTFDRGAGIAPFAIAQSDAAKVTNLDADKLDGEEGSFYLDRANHTGSTPSIVVGDITSVTSDRLIGRDTAGTGAAEQISLDTTLEFTGAQTIRRAALSGDVTATAGSNATTIANDAVTDAKLRDSSACSVIGRSANSTGNPADIATSTNNTLLARISNALAWVAGLVFDGSGAVQQIAFASTQSASTNANTLDDYEEGTWTPADGSGGVTITNVEAYYVKIGQLVTASCSFVYPANASGANTLITGLPFTILDTTGDLFMAQVFGSAAANHCAGGINNTTTLTFYTTAGLSQRVNSDFSNTAVRFTLTYRATA